MEYPIFANKVRVFREFREKTVYEVADAANVSHTYISQIENGKKLPSEKVLFPLIRFLGAKNDKGYMAKMENIEYNEASLLEAYARYKELDEDTLLHRYSQYVLDNITKDFNILTNAEVRNNNKIKISRKNDELFPLETPYYDLKWLLNQKDFYVMYGREYDIQELQKKEIDVSERSIFNVLKDEDISTIQDLIEAYLSNKYDKIHVDKKY